MCFVTHLDKEGAPYDGPTTTPCTQEEVLNIFKGWEEEVLALLRVRTVSEEHCILALIVRAGIPSCVLVYREAHEMGNSRPPSLGEICFW